MAWREIHRSECFKIVLLNPSKQGGGAWFGGEVVRSIDFIGYLSETYLKIQIGFKQHGQILPLDLLYVWILATL